MTIIATSAKVPKSLHQAMLERIIKDGYGMRGKSKWINEAIEKFLQTPNYPELVEIADDIEEVTEVISFRISKEMLLRLDQAVIEIRKQYPGLEGVKSNIIRASILQALIASNFSH